MMLIRLFLSLSSSCRVLFICLVEIRKRKGDDAFSSRGEYVAEIKSGG